VRLLWYVDSDDTGSLPAAEFEISSVETSALTHSLVLSFIIIIVVIIVVCCYCYRCCCSAEISQENELFV
jgi:hypothetical protein